jgi:hypothetical protein
VRIAISLIVAAAACTALCTPPVAAAVTHHTLASGVTVCQQNGNSHLCVGGSAANGDTAEETSGGRSLTYLNEGTYIQYQASTDECLSVKNDDVTGAWRDCSNFNSDWKFINDPSACSSCFWLQNVSLSGTKVLSAMNSAGSALSVRNKGAGGYYQVFNGG